MTIHTDQGPPLEDKYMLLLEFLSQGMKDREAVDVVYKLMPFIESPNDRYRLIDLLEALQ